MTIETAGRLRLTLARACAWALLVAGWVGLGSLALKFTPSLGDAFALTSLWLLALGAAATVATRGGVRRSTRGLALVHRRGDHRPRLDVSRARRRLARPVAGTDRMGCLDRARVGRRARPAPGAIGGARASDRRRERWEPSAPAWCWAIPVIFPRLPPDLSHSSASLQRCWCSCRGGSRKVPQAGLSRRPVRLFAAGLAGRCVA